MTGVERLWPGSTIVCLGGGPSLTQDDVTACRGRARVVAVNDAWRLAPFADVLYACDRRWWDHYQGVPEFTGLKFGLTVKVGKWPGVQRLPTTGAQGFDPEGIRTGANSGNQAIQLAVHLGASRIILLGYDMRKDRKGRDHWFGKHPTGLKADSPYETFCRYFASLVTPLADRGVRVVNCSRDTALTCFPRAALADVLMELDEVAA